jgi:hypothetical protein
VRSRLLMWAASLAHGSGLMGQAAWRYI